MRAESNGLVPTLSLHEVQVHDPSGRAGLRLPRVLLAVSVLAPASYGLDQVVLIPANVSPFKQQNPDMASGADRLAMCRLAGA